MHVWLYIVYVYNVATFGYRWPYVYPQYFICYVDPITDGNGEEDDTDNVALIAGITAGLVLAIIIVAAVVVFIILYKRRTYVPN